MFALKLILLFVVFWSTRCQQNIGDSCTVKTTKQQGVCKLLTDCPQASEDIFIQPCQGEGLICCMHNSPRTSGEKSKQKCKEYSKYETEKIAIPTASNTQQSNLHVERSLCGQLEFPSISNSLAETREFPHVVAIGYQGASNNITWVCGGTIVSEEYILTAAHCLHSTHQGSAKYVKVGTTDTSIESGHAEIYAVSKLIPHPNYKRPSLYNDIGLLKLEKPINLSPYAKPACLYTEPEIMANKAVATGWGHYGICPTIVREKLLKTPVDILDHSTCAKTYEESLSRRTLPSGILKDSQFCANANGTLCQTSGAPLQIYHTSDDAKCMYDVAGVISFGKGTDSTDVYTRVSNYIKWIEDTVWP